MLRCIVQLGHLCIRKYPKCKKCRLERVWQKGKISGIERLFEWGGKAKGSSKQTLVELIMADKVNGPCGMVLALFHPLYTHTQWCT